MRSKCKTQKIETIMKEVSRYFICLNKGLISIYVIILVITSGFKIIHNCFYQFDQN